MCQSGTKIILTALQMFVNCVNAPELLLLLENIVFWISHLVLLVNNKDGIPHGAEENETEGEGDADLVVVSIMEGGHRIRSLPDVIRFCRGLDNAGKTTILKRFNGESIDTISPTLGFNIKTLEHRGYTLNMWDVGGQKSLRSYWRNYFECTDGLVWVVDSADRMRLETCREELNVLLAEERLAGATLLVLANKQDLPGALSAQDIKEVKNTYIGVLVSVSYV